MFMATERHSQFCTDSGNNEALMSPSLKKRKKEHLIKTLSQKDWIKRTWGRGTHVWKVLVMTTEYI